MFIARAVCGVMSTRVVALCSSWSLNKYLERWQAALNEARWSLSFNGKEETHNPENWTQYTSLVTALFTVFSQLTPVHLTWGLQRVCAACPTPRLNLSFELRPSWNNTHDTFPTGATQDTAFNCKEFWIWDFI